MSLIYITGIAGSGKSSVRKELLKRGYEAHGTDEDGIAGFYHNETGKIIDNPIDAPPRTKEWREHHTWRISREAVEALAEKAKHKDIFLCGVASDDSIVEHLFSQVFALTLDEATLRHRLASRTNNSFGKASHELESMLEWQKNAKEDYEKLGAIIVDATKPVDEVVDEILKKVQNHVKTPIHLQALKPNGKLHQSWSSNLILRSGDWIITHSPYATPVRHHTKDLTYVMKHSNLGIFNTKEYYNVFIDFHKDGTFKMLYINIATPAVLKNNEITWTDLELDIVRLPGKLAELIDEDEFEEAKTNGLLPVSLADKAEEVAATLMKVVDEGAFPFMATNHNTVTRMIADKFSFLGEISPKLKNEVPFISNPDDHCVVAVIGMVLAYFMPEHHFTMPEIEKLVGYEKGHGTWKALSMLNLAKLGFEVHWIEDFDHEQFVVNPKAYLRTILDDKAYEWQIAHANLEQEASRIQQYIDSNLALEKRQATNDDIRHFLDDGWLVHLEVNARPLSNKSGYEGHSILVTGYDDNGVIIHNPDGESGNMPNQRISWELLDQAWKEFGGSYSLYVFRKGAASI